MFVNTTGRFGLLILGFALIAGGVRAANTRSIMDDVADTLAYLLPLSLDADRFLDPAAREEVGAKLNELANSAERLEQHAREKDTGFRLLSHSFAGAATQAKSYYDYLRPMEARFFLMDLTQNCVACHARLPNKNQFSLTKKLAAYLDSEDLERRERAQLQVALRQFDDALSSWEALFQDQSVPAVEFDIEGDLIDYLTIAVRVTQDLERARNTLAALHRRSDLPYYMGRHVERWRADIEQLKPTISAKPTLAEARDLFERSHALSVMPSGRERAVYDLVASSILYRWINGTRSIDPGELAEAYYMLGVIESRTIASYSTLPTAELYFEAAIRSAPKGPLAQQCYAILEEYSLLNYGDLMLEDPEEYMSRLRELKELITAQ